MKKKSKKGKTKTEKEPKQWLTSYNNVAKEEGKEYLPLIYTQEIILKKYIANK